MENPQADSSGGKAGDSATAAAGSGHATPAWNALPGQGQDDMSRLARAALQNSTLFGATTGTGAAGQGTPGADAVSSAANLMDPLGGTQLTSDQLAAMLAGSGYSAASLGALGMAGMQPADNAAALNALLMSGAGLGLNQLAAQSLLNPGLGDMSALGGMMGGGDTGEVEDGQAGGGGKQACLNVTSNKQLSSRFRWGFGSVSRGPLAYLWACQLAGPQDVQYWLASACGWRVEEGSGTRLASKGLTG